MLKKNWKKILIIVLIIIISTSIGAYADYLLTATQVSYGSGSVKTALDDLYTKAPKFTQGQLVTYEGEQFYVLYESKDTVELFAKTNIDPSTCASQVNVAYNDATTPTKCAFSSTNSYWSTIWNSLSGTARRINLNNINGFTDTDAIGKARMYARLKRAISGRLLTYEEVESLAGGTSWSSLSNTTIKNMLNGAGNTVQNFEYYWLGSASENYGYRVWLVLGEGSCLNFDSYYNSNACGVRPVISVYKSLVQ